MVTTKGIAISTDRMETKACMREMRLAMVLSFGSPPECSELPNTLLATVNNCPGGAFTGCDATYRMKAESQLQTDLKIVRLVICEMILAPCLLSVIKFVNRLFLCCMQ